MRRAAQLCIGAAADLSDHDVRFLSVYQKVRLSIAKPDFGTGGGGTVIPPFDGPALEDRRIVARVATSEASTASLPSGIEANLPPSKYSHNTPNRFDDAERPGTLQEPIG